MTPWLSVVGVGEDGLEALAPAARSLVDQADVLVGGERHHKLLPDHPAERLTWRRPLLDSMADIAAHRGRRVVVLATGDPMSYGIGVTLAREFNRDEMVILPTAGAFSLAGARLGWPVQEVTCLTLHGRPLATLDLHVAPGARLLIMSEDGDTPGKVAAALTERGYGGSQISVLAHMGGVAESRRDGVAARWDKAPCPALNIVAVTCVAGENAVIAPRVPGLPDDIFFNDGQLTKREVRAATLAALAPLPGQHLWDLGAGCGSIAIEWLRAADGMSAQAVEWNPDRAALIAQNACRLGVPNLAVIRDDVSAVLAGLAAPDAIFIGGGLTSPDLVTACAERLAATGRLVANAVTLEGEAVLLAAQSQHDGDLTRIAVSRAEAMGARIGWRALAPVTQWRWVKR